MPKLFTISKRIVLLSFIIVFISSFELSQAASKVDDVNEDMSDSADNEAYQQRRVDHFKKLRHFLLTSNTEQRSAKREKEIFLKRELIREYLQSINDPDSNRFEEVRKRIKTFCNSYEDIMDSPRAPCG